MHLGPIDPKKLQSDSETQSLWFRSDDGELYILFTVDEISYFEITFEQDHIEGGFQRTLKYGVIDDSALEQQKEVRSSIYKLSRLINFKEEIPPEILKKSIEIVFACQDLEQRMKEALMDYLNTEGKRSDLLQSEIQFESFRPIEAQRFSLIKFIKLHLKVFKIGFSVFVLSLLLLGLFDFINSDRDLALRKRCDQGEINPCQMIAYSLLMKGKGAQAQKIQAQIANLKKVNAIKYDRNKCKDGNSEACKRFYEFANHSDPNELEDACQKGLGEKKACLVLAKKLEIHLWKRKADNYKQDPAYHYFAWASSADNDLQKPIDDFFATLTQCRQGIVTACMPVAKKYRDKGLINEARESFHHLCRLNFAQACLEYGQLGQGERYISSLQKSCELDNLKGCLLWRLSQSRTQKDRDYLIFIYKSCESGIEKFCQKLKQNKFQ